MNAVSWKGSLLATSFSGSVNLLFIHTRRSGFNKQAVESLDTPLVCVLGIGLELGRGGSQRLPLMGECSTQSFPTVI